MKRELRATLPLPLLLHFLVVPVTGCIFLGSCPAMASMPTDLGAWHEEARRSLLDTTQLKSIERIHDSTTLLFKVHYHSKDPFGQPMKAIFKPVQKKWRKKKGRRSTENPVPPEIAAYALAMHGSSGAEEHTSFLFPPVVEIRLSKGMILELAEEPLTSPPGLDLPLVLACS